MSEGVENKYNTESLDFINTYKTFFSPVLTSIVETLNNNSIDNKAIIATMKAMTDDSNSNLRELIVKLKEMEDIGDNKSRPITNNGDYSKYVAQCLRIMRIKGSKNNIYELFNLVMQDLKKNRDLMANVEKIKANNTQWKKMVGMLIPPDARVKILTNIFEPVRQFAVGKHKNKSTSLTSRELIGTVVTRGKLDGYVTGGDFKKRVRLPKDMLRDKNEEIMEFDPEEIELHVPNAEGRGEAPPVAETERQPAGEAEAAETRQETGKPLPVATGAVATGATVASVAVASVASGTPLASGTPGSPAATEEAVDTQQVKLEEVIP